MHELTCEFIAFCTHQVHTQTEVFLPLHTIWISFSTNVWKSFSRPSFCIPDWKHHVVWKKNWFSTAGVFSAGTNFKLTDFSKVAENSFLCCPNCFLLFASAQRTQRGRGRRSEPSGWLSGSSQPWNLIKVSPQNSSVITSGVQGT